MNLGWLDIKRRNAFFKGWGANMDNFSPKVVKTVEDEKYFELEFWGKGNGTGKGTQNS